MSDGDTPRTDAEDPPTSTAPTPSFETFFTAQYPPVVRFGVALTGDLHSAEDLAQDAFLAARRNWDRVGAYDDPGAWVRRAVANRSVSRFRRLTTEAKALARVARPDPVELPEPHGRVWDEVRRLPVRQAQVIALVALEDRSVRDIAVILDCGEETVRTHLRRARSRLADVLGDTEMEEHDGPR